MSEQSFDSWAIVELMGHVRMAGRVTEEERFGSKVGRIDIPKDDGFTTVYFTAGSIYRLTAVSEEMARAVAKGSQPRPVHQWELPKPDDEEDEDAKHREAFDAAAGIRDGDDEEGHEYRAQRHWEEYG